jgi:hypothetical protein
VGAFCGVMLSAFTCLFVNS